MPFTIRRQRLQTLSSKSKDGQVGIVVVIINVSAVMIAVPTAATHAAAGSSTSHLLYIRHARYSYTPLLSLTRALRLQTQLSRQRMQKFALRVGQLRRHGEAGAGMVFAKVDQKLGEADAIGFGYRVDVGSLLAVDESGLGGTSVVVAAFGGC